MKTFIRTIVCCLIFTQLQAQPTFKSTDFPKKENTEWLSFKPTDRISANELKNNKVKLKLDTHDELMLLNIQEDELGFRHYRYQQTYKNIPIEGAIYLMHEKNNHVKNANGKLVQQLNLTTRPAISEATALQTALKFVGASLYAWDDPAHQTNLKHTQNCSDASFYPHGELVVIAPNEQKKANDYRLAYKFDIYAVQPLTRQIVYVDAQNETVLTSIEKIHNCTGVPASGATKYSGDVDFSACTIGGAYTLRNNDTDADIQVFDAGNTLGSPQVAITDTDRFFEGDSAAVEVYWATQHTYDYFFNTHGRNSLDDNGMALYSWVHHGINYNNAFWNGSWMTYGDGDNQKFSALSSPDVVGHEIMHGITDFSADLVYQYESGALNESFSDIFGEVVEAYSRGTNDWIMGADFTVQEGKSGLRNLSNPKDPNMLKQQPDTYFGDNWYSSGSGGVHTNSGVQNYWFYLLAEGGNGTNDFGHEYNIGAIGMSKAAAIAYRNLTVYLTPSSQYFDARTGAIQAAIDLYGENSNEVIQTEAAWAAVGVSTQVTNTCRERDSLALVALYNTTNGPNWTQTWNLTQPIDTWHGVTLNQGGCVSFLGLNSNQLEGNIPADLGDMGSLELLFLSANNLSGNIPTELGNLNNLRILDLAYNELVGSIPVELGNLNNLIDLYLISNQLSGSIPIELSNLNGLVKLYLTGNQLNGTIPPEFGNLTNLKTIVLGGNQLSGSIPADLSNLINLETLNLGPNQLSGHIPPELGNLTNLQSLGLYSNQLSGDIPEELGNLTNIETLLLMDNQLTGSIPSEFADLSNLTILFLMQNQLSGCYAPELINLCNDSTNVVINEDNNFDATWEDFCNTGAGMCNSYSACRETDSLALVALYNSTDGANWASPWDLTQPIDTWMGVTLNDLGCVLELRTSLRQLNGTIPPELGSLTSVEKLRITDCGHLVGNIPPELGNLSSLKYLSLTNTQLSGNIPPELGNLSNLLALSISSNQISGSIPPELSNLSNLTELNIYFNPITGNIPPELGNLSNLRFLNLGNNQLSGNIPPELGNLNNLLRLQLPNNQLTGNIPPELGNLSAISHLSLSRNQLTGNIPPELGNLSNLTHPGMSDNALSGCYDSNLTQLCDQFVNNPDYISDGNNFDTTWEDFCNTGAGMCGTQQSCRQSDSLALVAFYNEINGLTWNLTASMDTWAGITRNSDGCVTVIMLPSVGLSGTIASELGNLSHLNALYLFGNQLSGTIPSELGNLSKIDRLAVSFNQLSGEVPSELGNLTNLKELVLNDNQFSGSIPVSLGNLSNLESLTLSTNQLSGEIPTELGNLTNLITLGLYDNQLSGNIPVELGNLNKIEHITLSENQLIGDIPSEFAYLTNLTKLRLHQNQLSGCYAPEFINLCSQLTEANISEGNNFDASWEDFCNNNLGNCNPEVSCRQSDSLSLVAFYNEINGLTWDLNAPMDTWSGITLNNYGCITDILLNDSGLSGTIASELGNLSSLEDLRLYNNQLSGGIPVELSNLNRLVVLNLNNNELSGNIPVELGNLEHLTILVLGKNQLSGTIPQELGNLNNLQYLHLNENQLSGEIPVELTNLNSLKWLHLYINQLSGNIPVGLGDLHDLEFLYLHDNQLNGNIPPEVGNLVNLRALWLSGNQLIGNIPASFGNLTNLTSLYLTANQLNGNIPPEIGNLGNLKHLNLNDNQLSGNIPAELGNLANIEQLLLQVNQLTGNIPSKFAYLSNLTDLRLFTNQLSGCYPVDLNNLCNQLNYAYISEENNFDATWQAFCNTGAGSCDPLASAVWPGDFNNDGIVDNVDVLTWGLAEGNTGVARPNATSNWTAQSCPDWQTSVGLVNGKHQDGDGNGIVDVQDLEVLINNYDSIHTITSSDSPLQFRLEEVSSIQSNNQILTTYHLFAESSLGVPISTHGLACNLDFGDLPVQSVTVDILNSSLQADKYIDIFHTEQNILNLALTRTDHNNKLCDGAVASIIVAIEDLQSGEPFAISIGNGITMSANGELNPIGSTSLYGVVSIIGVAEQFSTFVSTTNERCNTLGEATAYASGGISPYTYTWSTGANTAQVNNLLAGTYTVEISDSNGENETLSIQINEASPIYDQAGNEIDCSQFIQWITPRLYVFLEGPYSTNTNTMTANLLPLLSTLNRQPYHEAPWKYRGTEGQGWDAIDYPVGTIDWVLVSFRDGKNMNNVLTKTAAILLEDGALHFPNNRILTTNVSDSIYVVIEHRNHIAVMTPQPITIINNTLTYDFRINEGYRTPTSFGQKQLPDGSWAMFTGDCNQISDTNGYDINGQDKVPWGNLNGNFGIYVLPDFNLDKDVNGADKILWFDNNGINSLVPK